MLALLVLLAVGCVSADNPCEGLADGTVPEWACRSYTYCMSEIPIIVDCSAADKVYNPDTQKCDDPLNVPYPCGQWRDCTGKEDRRYVDPHTEDCTAYYTCHNEYFYGYNVCPEGLVYHEAMQICDWPRNVPPPCGTKEPEPTTLAPDTQ